MALYQGCLCPVRGVVKLLCPLVQISGFADYPMAEHTDRLSFVNTNKQNNWWALFVWIMLSGSHAHSFLWDIHISVTCSFMAHFWLLVANILEKHFVAVVVYSLSHVRLFVMLCTIAHQAPLFMWLPSQEYWSGLPFPFPGDLLDPGIECMSPALAGRFFTTEAPGKPPGKHYPPRNASKSVNQNSYKCLMLFGLVILLWRILSWGIKHICQRFMAVCVLSHSVMSNSLQPHGL